MRYFIDITYHGKGYHGFQKQPDAISVQEVVEEAITVYFQESKAIVGAGRTDTGVHAKQLVAHIDVDLEINPKQFLYKLNKLLPKDISIQDIYRVNDQAHARFDAASRVYEYIVATKKNPFLADRALYIKKDLDVDLMNQASKILLDYSDFECFSKVKTQVKTFICKITEAHWKTDNERLIFTISADRFLRNMVRAIVGTLLEVGLHKRTPESLHALINSKNRSRAGKSVLAQGLYLTQVNYPENIKNLELTREQFTTS